MHRLLIFIFIVWIINKLFRNLFSISKNKQRNPAENISPKRRGNMDIQDAEFEDLD